jgi:hypothetical protein
VRPASLNFLLSSSRVSVQNFELSQRNLAANLAKQLKLLIDEIVELRVNAEVARLRLDNERALSGKDAETPALDLPGILAGDDEG